MNLLLDLYVLGWLLVLLGAFQAPAVATAVIYGEDPFPYLFSMLVALVAGLVLTGVTRSDTRALRPRDGFFVVGSAWVMASIGGALPFVSHWISAGVLEHVALLRRGLRPAVGGQRRLQDYIPIASRRVA